MKVSVVIPTYKRGELIRRAIESVIKQTYNELEIIIVSDGKYEETDNIVNEYKKLDSRIHYISYDHSRGANYARNAGIKYSTGNFVAFLDDDDEWVENKVEYQLKIFSEDSDIGLVYTGTQSIYEDDQLSYNTMPSEGGDLSIKIFEKNYIGITSTVMVRRDVLLKAGMFDEGLPARQDYDLWIRVCQLCKIGFVNQTMIKYYNNSANNQISSNILKYEKAIDILNKKYRMKINEINPDLLTNWDVENNFMMANKALRNSDKKVGRNYIKKNFKIKIRGKDIALYIMSFLNYEWSLKLQKIRKKQ